MAVKSKAPAKKAAKKAAPKKPAPKPVKKSAVKSVKPAAKPAAKATRPATKAATKSKAKAPAKAPVKAVAKPVSKPAKAAPPAPTKKGPGGKALPPLPPKRAPIAAGARPVAPAPVVAPPSPMPAPRPIAPKPQAAVSTKDVAAAHEYLLTRSASRSEAPVIVNGKQLPTEERLLKMPESAYMNGEQLAFFKYRLQQMERELLANADETTEHLRETVIVPDPADRATIEEEHALELRTRDRERKLLKKVQQALGRIESGDYGFCEETGDPIGIPRLLARPTATLSLEAQQRRELKQKLYGD
ncbi:MAG: RNA polymerase-binding protein DksA [Comamonadaceae bacterium]|nr:RNA polymerase-binding protein DksA [Comamonadaceae bacterium]